MSVIEQSDRHVDCDSSIAAEVEHNLLDAVEAFRLSVGAGPLDGNPSTAHAIDAYCTKSHIHTRTMPQLWTLRAWI